MITSTHLFAGGCGDVRGYGEGGIHATFTANHDTDSVETARLNFPGVRSLQCDINNLDFRSVPRTPVLIGSPICTEIAPAGRNASPRIVSTLDDADGRPAAPEFARTRATAWDLIRADEVHDYDVVCGENVIDFATRWRLFNAWLGVWEALGKQVQVVSVNAAHVRGPGNTAAPQHRNRVLFVFTKRGLPQPDLTLRPECVCPQCGPVLGIRRWGRRFDRPGVRKVGNYGSRQQYVYICPTPRCHRPATPVTEPIRPHIDWSTPGRRFGDGKPHTGDPYSPATTSKVKAGYERFGGAPFLVILRKNATVASLDDPIPALTTGNHHLLVRPGEQLADAEVRQLTPLERARAQRFPDTHQFAGSEVSQKRQIGNAVPVNVASWLAHRLRPTLEAAA